MPWLTGDHHGTLNRGIDAYVVTAALVVSACMHLFNQTFFCITILWLRGSSIRTFTKCLEVPGFQNEALCLLHYFHIFNNAGI